MRHTRLAAVLGMLLAFPCFAFDITSPSTWFGGDKATTMGRSHDPSHAVVSNGVTKVQMQHLYREDWLVTDVDLEQAGKGITNIVAGHNVIVEDVGDGGRVKRISAVGGGIDADGVNLLIRTYDNTNLTHRISAKQDVLTAGPNITIQVVGEQTVISATGGGGGGSDIDWHGVTNVAEAVVTEKVPAWAIETVPTITNGFVTASITNGLVTAAITNGLASASQIPPDYRLLTAEQIAAIETISNKADITSLAGVSNIAAEAYETATNLQLRCDEYLPNLLHYATNNYKAAKLANYRALRLERWQWDVARDRAVYEMAYDHWVWGAGDGCPDDFIDGANAYGAQKPSYDSVTTAWAPVHICGPSGQTYVGTVQGAPASNETSLVFSFVGSGVTFTATAVRPSSTDGTPVRVNGTASLAVMEDIDAVKRDKTDLSFREPKNVHWVWTSDDPNCPEGWLAKANRFGEPKPAYNAEYGWWLIAPIGGKSQEAPGIGGASAVSVLFAFDHAKPFAATATRASATDTTLVLVDEIARASQLDYVEQRLKDKADEFTKWEFSDGVERQWYFNNGYYNDHDPDWDGAKSPPDTSWLWNYGDEDDLSVDALTWPSREIVATASRKRVLRTGDALPTSFTNEERVAIGRLAESHDSFYGVAIGNRAKSFKNGTAVGNYTSARGLYSTAVGVFANASNDSSTVIGNYHGSHGPGTFSVSQGIGGWYAGGVPVVEALLATGYSLSNVTEVVTVNGVVVTNSYGVYVPDPDAPTLVRHGDVRAADLAVALVDAVTNSSSDCDCICTNLVGLMEAHPAFSNAVRKIVAAEIRYVRDLRDAIAGIDSGETSVSNLIQVLKSAGGVRAVDAEGRQ